METVRIGISGSIRLVDRMREYLNDTEYLECVGDILCSEIFKKLDKFVQHGATSTMVHSIDVSYTTYLVCKAYNLNYKSAARAALLHDFYLYDWHRPARETGAFLHGFTHPYRAAKNAKKYFNISEAEASMIKTHMFPLTPIPPMSLEGWVLTMADKSASINEIAKNLRLFANTGEGTL